MKIRTKFLLISSSIVILGSCKKETPIAVPGTTEIEITFQSPTTTSVATIGNELNVEGIIDANAIMGGWNVCITSCNDDTIAFYEDHYEQTQYIFHYHWFPTPQDTGNVTIQVEALDISFNSLATEKIQIQCH